MSAIPTAFLTVFAMSVAAIATPIDITFFQVGDPHYLAFDSTANFNTSVRGNLQRMMALTTSSAMPGAGTVGSPLGVIACGDLLNSGNETDPATGLAIGKQATLEKQWANYSKDFGLLGNEVDSVLKYPVYEGYGNHDQDGYLKQISDNIAARALLLPNITARSGTYTYSGGYGVSVTGVHYAWKWGPVHFVQANMRSGNGGERYSCSGSYSFLKDYLENKVAASGDPVFVAVHLPPSTGAEGDWPKADRQAFYDLLRRFNTVGILVGHVHSYAYSLWRGPDNTGDVAIPVYQCDSLNHSGTTQGIFTAFRIVGDPVDPTKATVYTAQRLKNNTWGANVSRTISLSAVVPPPPDPPPVVDVLSVNQWQSVNPHNGVPCGLPITDNSFVEPRQAGITQIEILFNGTIDVPNLDAALTISGTAGSGVVSPASYGYATHVVLGPNSDSLVVTFSNGPNPVALPDAVKWRVTLTPAAITGTTGAVLSASSGTTRVITSLIGDFNGTGRVTGTDLNQIANTTAYDPAIVDCLRADINGDGQINAADMNAAWSNRAKRTDNLSTP